MFRCYQDNTVWRGTLVVEKFGEFTTESYIDGIKFGNLCHVAN